MPEASEPKRAAAMKAPSSSKSSRKRTSPEVANVDESLWRESKILKTKMIAKADAMKRYRLQDKDFKNLDNVEVDTKTKAVIDGVEQPVTAYLYNEREIERVAWRKHGGPEEWEAHLAKLKEGWEKQQESKPRSQRQKDFPEPRREPIRAGRYNPDAAPAAQLTPTKNPRIKKAGQEAI